jgi:CheY-specific phosphatase CheX
MFGNGWFQYAVTVFLTVCGAVVFSMVVRMGIEAAGKIVKQMNTKMMGTNYANIDD